MCKTQNWPDLCSVFPKSNFEFSRCVVRAIAVENSRLSILHAGSSRKVLTHFKIRVYDENAHAGSRTRVTSMGGLYDTATLRALPSPASNLPNVRSCINPVRRASNLRLEGFGRDRAYRKCLPLFRDLTMAQAVFRARRLWILTWPSFTRLLFVND